MLNNKIHRRDVLQEALSVAKQKQGRGTFTSLSPHSFTMVAEIVCHPGVGLQRTAWGYPTSAGAPEWSLAPVLLRRAALSFCAFARLGEDGHLPSERTTSTRACASSDPSTGAVSPFFGGADRGQGEADRRAMARRKRVLGPIWVRPMWMASGTGKQAGGVYCSLARSRNLRGCSKSALRRRPHLTDMPGSAYPPPMRRARRAASLPEKPLAWLSGEVKTPPMSSTARIESGMLLRRLQQGEILSMPEARPMPSIGPRCGELRIDDIEKKKEWRIVYYIGHLAIAVLAVFAKNTRTTPDDVITNCKRRLSEFQAAEAEAEDR